MFQAVSGHHSRFTNSAAYAKIKHRRNSMIQYDEEQLQASLTGQMVGCQHLANQNIIQQNIMDTTLASVLYSGSQMQITVTVTCYTGTV